MDDLARNENAVVDTHAHFWSWPSEPGARLHADRVADRAPHAYGHGPLAAQRLLGLLDGAGVDKLLQVTPAILGNDNEQSVQGALAHPGRIRVIARVDPFAPDLDSTLAELTASGMVVGLRWFAFEPEAARIPEPSMDRYWKLAAEHRLPVSIYAPGRTRDIGMVAERNPATTFVLDHLAVDLMGAPSTTVRGDEWATMLDLARHPNVSVKLSCVPEAVPAEQVPSLGASMVREVVDAYGANRVMWGSNYPPAGRAAPYHRLVVLSEESMARLDPRERAMVWGGTAIRVFGLPWSTESDGPARSPARSADGAA